ncbi:MAG: Ig-like domain-containing protein, partial [Motilibacteraceae bacterium]
MRASTPRGPSSSWRPSTRSRTRSSSRRPRTSASSLHVCPGTLPVGPLDHVAVSGGATILVGTTAQLTATAQDANNQTVSDATITSWKSSDESIATVDATGKIM